MNTPMRGTEWRLVAMGGVPVADPARAPTLLLGRDGRMGGSSGCNRYAGAFTTRNGVLAVSGPLAGTMMACVEPGIEVERAFLNRLARGGRAEVGNRGQLTISAEGQPDLEFGRGGALPDAPPRPR